MEFLVRLIEKYGLCGLCFALAVFGLTFLIKWGYKLLTAKIQTEEYRKLANAPIVFFPVCLGVLVWMFYNAIVKEYNETEIVLAGVITGGGAIIFYELIGRRIEDAILCGIKNEKLKKALQTRDNELEEMKNATKEIYNSIAERLENEEANAEEVNKNKISEFLDKIKNQ